MQIVKIDAMKKSVTKMTIALLHILTNLKTTQTNVKKICLLCMYIYRYVGFKKKWTTGFYSKHPATEGNLPVRVLKYKCQMQLKMHSDRSGSQNLEFEFFGSPMKLRVYGMLNKGVFKKN